MTGVDVALMVAVVLLAAGCVGLLGRIRALKGENERLMRRLVAGDGSDGGGSVGGTDGRCERGEGRDEGDDGRGEGGDGRGDGDERRDDDDEGEEDAGVTAGEDAGATAGEDAELFASIDRRIDEGRLYLDPGFGRDSICRLTGLSKERVGQLIKHGGVGNLQVYVNRKRAAYAKQLMHEHANYTMEAIANECGIGNLSTFYRIFKQVYGVSPAEFRRSVAGGVFNDN